MDRQMDGWAGGWVIRWVGGLRVRQDDVLEEGAVKLLQVNIPTFIHSIVSPCEVLSRIYCAVSPTLLKWLMRDGIHSSETTAGGFEPQFHEPNV